MKGLMVCVVTLALAVSAFSAGVYWSDDVKDRLCKCRVQASDVTVQAPPLRHPVFATPVSYSEALWPALQLDILDAAESWFGNAELYLSVQSSRFPNETRVLLPVNVGSFDGCRSRFVELPFEIQPGDVLIFDLLDDDKLSDEEEKLILQASRELAFCIWKATEIYKGENSWLNPLALLMKEIKEERAELNTFLGKALFHTLRLNQFDNYGSAKYIVPESMPTQPHAANKLTVLDDANYARVQLRIYSAKKSFSGSAKPSGESGQRL